MTRCRVPQICQSLKLDVGIYDDKSKKNFLGVLKRRTFVYTFKKINIVLFGWKIEEMLYLMG